MTAMQREAPTLEPHHRIVDTVRCVMTVEHEAEEYHVDYPLKPDRGRHTSTDQDGRRVSKVFKTHAVERFAIAKWVGEGLEYKNKRVLRSPERRIHHCSVEQLLDICNTIVDPLPSRRRARGPVRLYA